MHLTNFTLFRPIVLSKKIDRAHNKLQKWDQMANKITELSEQKQQKAREKEIKLQKKLEQAQKHKEEQIKYQKDMTLERLQKWQQKRDKFSQTVTIKDKKRMNLANKLTNQDHEDIEKRRTMMEKDKLERHHRMYDKTRLEKLNVANRHNYLADQTFQKGQSILGNVSQKIKVAEERKNNSLSELKRREAQHNEKVYATLE